MRDLQKSPPCAYVGMIATTANGWDEYREETCNADRSEHPLCGHEYEPPGAYDRKVYGEGAL